MNTSTQSQKRLPRFILVTATALFVAGASIGFPNSSSAVLRHEAAQTSGAQATLARDPAVKVAGSEMEAVRARFLRAGWKTETHDTSLHRFLVILANEEPHYLFRFEKWPDGPRGLPSSDPNFRPDRSMSGDPINAFYGILEWQELEPIALKLGFDAEKIKTRAAEAARTTVIPVALSSPTVRKLTPAEAKSLLQAIRKQGLVQRSVYGPSGESVEDLPFDARITRSFLLSDVVWAELESKVAPLITKYPVITRVTPSGLMPVFLHADDVSSLPFDPAFPEVTTIYKAAPNELFAWWNYYEENQGQAGL
ncbi:MAG: hypothetical protein V4671_11655 [Armatimonadota bacterium]